MNPRVERRKIDSTSEDQLSPEALALLVSCGGDIREGDWAVIGTSPVRKLPERRNHERRGEDRRSRERRRPGADSGPE